MKPKIAFRIAFCEGEYGDSEACVDKLDGKK